jgi:hypothetical protein
MNGANNLLRLLLFIGIRHGGIIRHHLESLMEIALAGQLIDE